VKSVSHYPGRAAAIFLTGLGLVAAPALADAQRPNPASSWHFVRAANPRGGPDTLSMSHTADTSRSDLDLAGLMLRCGREDKEPVIVIVVVTPFPPRARPDVVIAARGKEWPFSARVVPPGAELQLPAEAMSLAVGTWQAAGEIAVKVTSHDQQPFGGVIPIEGLAEALATLTANCTAG
jgi:hypothetical protein